MHPSPTTRRIACTALAAASLFASGCSRALGSNLDACTKATSAQDAVAACTRVVDAGKPLGDVASALSHRGSAYQALGQPEAAMRDLDASVKRKPNDADLLANRGAILNIQERLGPALRDLEAALALDPRNVLALGNRAIVHDKHGEFGLARRDVDLALDIDPSRYELWAERCWIGAVLADKLSQSAKDCDKAIAMQSGDPNNFNNRGLLNFRSGRFAEAIADYDRAIAANPAVASSHLIRGLSKRAAGVAGGDADVAHALALDPGVAARYAGYGVKAGGAAVP